MTHRRQFLQAGAALGLGCLTASAPFVHTSTARADQARRGRSVFIMTDMEGVAGVIDCENWCNPESRYYELGREFLTLEVNAAIEGFARAGITDFLVVDGHGAGAIHPKLLDPRADLARNWPPQPYPFYMDKGMDFIAWIGQHAMSRTEYAHIAHTGSFASFENTINGTPVGEFGEVAVCASQLGIRSIFAAGDLALTKEAQAFMPGIETVAVKRGMMPGRGDECTSEAYAKRNLAAIHHQPERARQMIREGAERAVRRAQSEGNFGLISLKPPFERIMKFRPSATQPRATIARATHPDDVIALLNAPLKFDTPSQPATPGAAEATHKSE